MRNPDTLAAYEPTAGDVLIHPALDCHANQWSLRELKLIRLDWTDTSGIGGLYHLDEVDELARTAEKDVVDSDASTGTLSSKKEFTFSWAKKRLA